MYANSWLGFLSTNDNRALVAERLLEAFRKMKGSIFDPITDLENSVNRALLRYIQSFYYY